jgi:hypothetical protein
MPSTERGPGGWPVDPELAFFEVQGKFHEARKEADHWRSNHTQLLLRFKAAQAYRGDLVEDATLLKRVADELPRIFWRASSRNRQFPGTRGKNAGSIWGTPDP